MKINRRNLDWALAAQCMAASELRQYEGFSSAAIARIRKGYDISPKTAGRLAKALNVPLEKLVIDLGGEDTITGVTLDSVALRGAAATQGLTVKQILELAGVTPIDAVAIRNGRPIALSTAWRVSDTLGIPLARLIEKEEF